MLGGMPGPARAGGAPPALPLYCPEGGAVAEALCAALADALAARAPDHEIRRMPGDGPPAGAAALVLVILEVDPRRLRARLDWQPAAGARSMGEIATLEIMDTALRPDLAAPLARTLAGPGAPEGAPLRPPG